MTLLKSCGTYQLEDGDTTLILEQDAYGATTNLYGSGFLTIEKGQLITVTDLDSGDGTTGTAVFGVFDSLHIAQINNSGRITHIFVGARDRHLVLGSVLLDTGGVLADLGVCDALYPLLLLVVVASPSR